MSLTDDPTAAKRLARARLVDRVAKRVISIGGVAVLAAVVAIFVFIGYEAFPLLRGASVETVEGTTTPLDSANELVAVASDEYREVLALLRTDGEIEVRRRTDPTATRSVSLDADDDVTSAYVTRKPTMLIAGTADGMLIPTLVEDQIAFDDDGVRSVDLGFDVGDPLDADDDYRAIRHIAARVVDDETVIAVVAGDGFANIVRFRFGMGRARVAALPEFDGATITDVELASFQDTFRSYVALDDGRVFRHDFSWTSEPELFESIAASSSSVTAMCVLLGEETLITGDDSGALTAWFGVRPTPDASNWNLTKIRELPALDGPVAHLLATPRGKSFIAIDTTGAGGMVHNTTERRLGDLPPIAGGFRTGYIAPKNDGLFVVDGEGSLSEFSISAPHPEATPASLFLPVWYESAVTPAHKWQSTGGESDFEPKLSLTTLVFGSLKGVFYALLFSIPVAIAAAIYTALFLPADLRGIVKPGVEIMAALPSVVIGLLAALFLSPLVKDELATVFMIPPAFIVAFTLLVGLWSALPKPARLRFSTGVGMMGVAMPVLLLTGVFAVIGGSLAETLVTGPDTAQWMRAEFEIGYDPRNAMVVGFAMGFAVVPVIFTIADDAIGNVPKSLWAASEALGASRWQTTYRVVLPAAAPGIFAALMLGFGRAIGETMIVLMATGNTPILDFSAFNGMRTISACIAVEIPEAPHGGTLYRVLFLSGALLFAFTFLCNTVAEVVGHRLRQKYGRF